MGDELVHEMAARIADRRILRKSAAAPATSSLIISMPAMDVAWMPYLIARRWSIATEAAHEDERMTIDAQIKGARPPSGGTVAGRD